MHLAPKQRALFKILNITSRQLMRIETPCSTYCRGSLSQLRGGMQVLSWEPSDSQINYWMNVITSTCISLYIYIYIYIYIHTHTLAAYTRHCLANVNMKYYRSLSNFGLVCSLISFWQLKQLSVGVANKKTTHIITPTYD